MKKTYVLFGLLFVMLLFTGMASAVAPVLSNEVPSDGSTLWDVPTATINITIFDIDSNHNWTIETYPDVGSDGADDETNGSKTCSLSSMLYSTTYTWYVNSSDVDGSEWTNASYTFTTRPAKLRENAVFTGVEKAIIGVVGIIVLVGFLYVVMKTDYAKKEGGIAKILVGIMIALVLLTVIFSSL